MNKMQPFAVAFLAKADSNKDRPGFVSKASLGKLRREHNIDETAHVLVRKEWLKGETGAGAGQIGWYSATEKLIEVSKEQSEPTDTCEYAKFLIAQKSAVLAELDKVNAKLARIEVAEKALAAIEGLREQK